MEPSEPEFPLNLSDSHTTRQFEQRLADHCGQVAARLSAQGYEGEAEYWRGQAAEAQRLADDPNTVNPFTGLP